MKLENISMDIHTQLVFNIGYPIKSSNAPIAYNKLFSQKDMNMLMLPLEVNPDSMGEFMKALKVMNVRYLCPTMPHKSGIIPYLDDVDNDSRLFNSVNAVKIDEDGTSHGIGMDGRGTINALLAAGVNLEGANVMLIGAGSICGVIGLELSRCKAAQVTLLNRTVQKAQEIADKLNQHTNIKAKALESTPENLDQCAKTADIVIQATPLGMKGFEKDYTYLGFIDQLSKQSAVLDVVLNPPCTSFQAKAKACGLRTIPGMQMLLGQMDAIFEYLFDTKLSAQDRQACEQALYAHLGIVQKK